MNHNNYLTIILWVRICWQHFLLNIIIYTTCFTVFISHNSWEKILRSWRNLFSPFIIVYHPGAYTSVPLHDVVQLFKQTEKSRGGHVFLLIKSVSMDGKTEIGFTLCITANKTFSRWLKIKENLLSMCEFLFFFYIAWWIHLVCQKPFLYCIVETSFIYMFFYFYCCINFPTALG